MSRDVEMDVCLDYSRVTHHLFLDPTFVMCGLRIEDDGDTCIVISANCVCCVSGLYSSQTRSTFTLRGSAELGV
jgi:hypothetical protein